MELDPREVRVADIISILDWAAQYGNGITHNAAYHAVRTGRVDYVRVGKTYFVVLTEETLRYKPNRSPARPAEKQESPT